MGYMKEENIEINFHQLKLNVQDGKYRLIDVVDIEEMFRTNELFLVRILFY